MSRAEERQLLAATEASRVLDQQGRIITPTPFGPSTHPPTASVSLRGTLSSSLAAPSEKPRTLENNNNLPTSSIVSAATPRPPQITSLVNSHAMQLPSSKFDPSTTISEIQSFTDSNGQTNAAQVNDSTEDMAFVPDSDDEAQPPLLGSSERVPDQPAPSSLSSHNIESASSTLRPHATKVQQQPSSRPSDDVSQFSSAPHRAATTTYGAASKRRAETKAQPVVEIVKPTRSNTSPVLSRSRTVKSSTARSSEVSPAPAPAPGEDDEILPIPSRRLTAQSTAKDASSVDPAQRQPSAPVERRKSRGLSRSASVEVRHTAPVEDDDAMEAAAREISRVAAAEADRKLDDDDSDFAGDEPKSKKKVSKKAAPKKAPAAKAARAPSKKAQAAKAKRDKNRGSIAELVIEVLPAENEEAVAMEVDGDAVGGAVEKPVEAEEEEEAVVVKSAGARPNKRMIVQDSDDEAGADDSGYVGAAEDIAPIAAKAVVKKVARKESKTLAGRPNRNKAKAVVESEPDDSDADSIIATDKEDADDDSDDSSGSPQRKKKKNKTTSKERVEMVMAAAKEAGATNPLPSTSAIPQVGQASVQAAASFRAPSSNIKPNPRRGLSAVLQKSGIYGNRAPGLSMRSKVPRLHSTLKERPPERDALPKEKPKPRKKGDEDYSDEERPWYDTKHPDDWDSDDREEWAKIAKTRGDGF